MLHFVPMGDVYPLFIVFFGVISLIKVHEPVVVVAYSKDAQQFWADIRKEEEDMGISVSDGVRIDMYRGMTTFRSRLLFGNNLYFHSY